MNSSSRHDCTDINVCFHQVIYYTYMGGAVYQASSALVSGELSAGLRFITLEGGWHGLPVIAM
jgi:hypothetical protein